MTSEETLLFCMMLYDDLVFVFIMHLCISLLAISVVVVIYLFWKIINSGRSLNFSHSHSQKLCCRLAADETKTRTKTETILMARMVWLVSLPLKIQKKKALELDQFAIHFVLHFNVRQTRNMKRQRFGLRIKPYTSASLFSISGWAINF